MANPLKDSSPQTEWGLSAVEQERSALWNVVVGVLLIIGFLLVIGAEALGKLSAQHWDSKAPWYPEEAHAAANTFRALGLMAFVAGLAERVILAVRGRQPPAP